MYAIIRTGGKQYRVEPGQILDVDRIPAAVDDTVEFGEVLMIGDGATVTAGTPLVDGARVIARNLGEVKGEKIIVFKYKPKTRYRRKAGHRSHLLRVRVEEIATSTGSARQQAAAVQTAAPAEARAEEAPAKPARRRAAKAEETTEE
jgi:large subunit ribosomal protein L21